MTRSLLSLNSCIVVVVYEHAGMSCLSRGTIRAKQPKHLRKNVALITFGSGNSCQNLSYCKKEVCEEFCCEEFSWSCFVL